MTPKIKVAVGPCSGIDTSEYLKMIVNWVIVMMMMTMMTMTSMMMVIVM